MGIFRLDGEAVRIPLTVLHNLCTPEAPDYIEMKVLKGYLRVHHPPPSPKPTLDSTPLKYFLQAEIIEQEHGAYKDNERKTGKNGSRCRLKVGSKQVLLTIIQHFVLKMTSLKRKKSLNPT